PGRGGGRQVRFDVAAVTGGRVEVIEAAFWARARPGQPKAAQATSRAQTMRAPATMAMSAAERRCRRKGLKPTGPVSPRRAPPAQAGPGAVRAAAAVPAAGDPRCRTALVRCAPTCRPGRRPGRGAREGLAVEPGTDRPALTGVRRCLRARHRPVR